MVRQSERPQYGGTSCALPEGLYHLRFFASDLRPSVLPDNRRLSRLVDCRRVVRKSARWGRRPALVQSVETAYREGGRTHPVTACRGISRRAGAGTNRRNGEKTFSRVHCYRQRHLML